MNIDMVIYVVGAFGIAGITAGLFLYGIITRQFSEDESLKCKPIEEGETD